jgi:hypothetical protein
MAVTPVTQNIGLTDINNTLLQQNKTLTSVQNSLFGMLKEDIARRKAINRGAGDALEDEREKNRNNARAKSSGIGSSFLVGALGEGTLSAMDKLGASAFGALGGLAAGLSKQVGRGLRFGVAAVALNGLAQSAIDSMFENFTWDDNISEEDKSKFKKQTSDSINTGIGVKFLGGGIGMALAAAVGAAFGDDIANTLTSWLGTNVIDAPNPLSWFGIGPDTLPVKLNNPLVQQALGAAGGMIVLALIRTAGVMAALAVGGITAAMVGGSLIALGYKDLGEKLLNTGKNAGKAAVAKANPFSKWTSSTAGMPEPVKVKAPIVYSDAPELRGARGQRLYGNALDLKARSLGINPDGIVKAPRTPPNLPKVPQTLEMGNLLKFTRGASALLSLTALPFTALDAGHRARALQTDALTAGIAGLVGSVVSIGDNLLNLPSAGVNYVGKALGFDPGLKTDFNAAGMVEQNIIKGVNSVTGAATDLWKLINGTSTTPVLQSTPSFNAMSPLAPPRADAPGTTIIDQRDMSTKQSVVNNAGNNGARATSAPSPRDTVRYFVNN